MRGRIYDEEGALVASGMLVLLGFVLVCLLSDSYLGVSFIIISGSVYIVYVFFYMQFRS